MCSSHCAGTEGVKWKGKLSAWSSTAPPENQTFAPLPNFIPGAEGIQLKLWSLTALTRHGHVEALPFLRGLRGRRLHAPSTSGL